MKLGFFTMPIHRLDRNYTEVLQEDREAVILADRLGYSEAYVGEHVTDAAESITNSMLFQASLISETKQIALGTGTANLSHTHPVLIAAQAAMLDHLLKGRFLLGISPGALESDAEALGIRDLDRGEMFLESIGHILDIWQGEPPYDLKGKHWNITTRETLFPEIGVGPIARPYQKPHPPILATVVSPHSKSAVEIGRRGFFPISANFLQPEWVPTHWAKYEQGCAEAGRAANRGNWRVARSIFVHDDHRTALDYGKRNGRSPYRFYFRQLFTKLKKANRHAVFKPHPEFPDEKLTLDYVVESLVIAGDPASVTDQLLAFREVTGNFGTLLYAGKDWEDKALGRRSMELMAEKVMPALNAAIGDGYGRSSFVDSLAGPAYRPVRAPQPASVDEPGRRRLLWRSLLMAMKPRERIDYSAIVDREPLALPDGKRVAVWVIVNIENWDIAKPMPRTVLPPPGHQVHIPDIPNWSWQEYGMRVGFWRFHEALVSRGIPVTMSVNGSVCVQYPRIAAAARDAGWEFLGHAYRQRPTHLIEDQREDIRQTVETIRAFTGRAPRGWMGPGLTETFETPDYLAEAGIEYVADFPMDDQPFDIRTEHGALTSIPYTVELNDIPMMLIQHHKAAEFYDRCMDAFERLEREGERSARVMAIAVHPYISGTPFRIKYFEKVLDAVSGAGSAVLWTGSGILDWYRAARPRDGGGA